MTEGEILEMTAGRELNVKVAEDVMGYQFARDEIFGDMQVDDSSGWRPLSCYSEDAATIPEILDRLSQFHQTEIDLDCFQGRWQADLNVDGDGVNYYYPDFNAFSLPEAICKAALLVAHGDNSPSRQLV